MTYTGVGSRETPEDILKLMWAFAHHMAHRDHTLRSGGAPGADMAFEKGCAEGEGYAEIFLPWRGFNGHRSGKLGSWENRQRAAEIAEMYHPAWSRCTEAARKLHTRNVFVVLGSDLNTPSRFVLCWTPRGEGGGGTGQAIRIARGYDVPVIDLGPLKANTAVPVSWVLDHLRHRLGVEL